MRIGPYTVLSDLITALARLREKQPNARIADLLREVRGGNFTHFVGTEIAGPSGSALAASLDGVLEAIEVHEATLALQREPCGIHRDSVLFGSG